MKSAINTLIRSSSAELHKLEAELKAYEAERDAEETILADLQAKLTEHEKALTLIDIDILDVMREIDHEKNRNTEN